MMPSLSLSNSSICPLSPQYPNLTPAIWPELKLIRDSECYWSNLTHTPSVFWRDSECYWSNLTHTPSVFWNSITTLPVKYKFTCTAT